MRAVMRSTVDKSQSTGGPSSSICSLAAIRLMASVRISAQMVEIDHFHFITFDYSSLYY